MPLKAFVLHLLCNQPGNIISGEQTVNAKQKLLMVFQLKHDLALSRCKVTKRH
jgi:hypothetical protein